MKKDLFASAVEKFVSWYGCEPDTAAYAPGRVEILGNHTDYNEGYVLSAAINYGTYFIAAKSADDECRIVAGDLMKEARFSPNAPKRDKENDWANYVIGVIAGLSARYAPTSFNGLFFGDIPLGSGLSSSAALEMSAALALLRLEGQTTSVVELARIGQKAEQEYAGANIGLLDQITSMSGKKDHLVMCDFRTLDISNIALSPEICFLACDTGTTHSIGDSEYNSRRHSCERAADFFSQRLDHPVSALRDVTLDEWKRFEARMDREDAQRSVHVIGENERVLSGKALLEADRIGGFGDLMFESHESSRHNFENSCDELDVIIDAAAQMPLVYGARLSGGGFGGSAVLLLKPADAMNVSESISELYRSKTGLELTVRLIKASAGAYAFDPNDGQAEAFTQ
jgi:galactokinase